VSRRFTREQLGRQIERLKLGAEFGGAWKNKQGEQILNGLTERGLAPPFIPAPKRTPGPGRTVEYPKEAVAWLQELAERVKLFGWKNAKGPMILRREAILVTARIVSPQDALLARVILDRAVCDLLNLRVLDEAALNDAADWVRYWRGDPPQAEALLTRLVDEEADRQRAVRRARWRKKGVNIIGSEELVGGIGALLSPEHEEGFLGTDLSAFNEQQILWRGTIEAIEQDPDATRKILEDRHGVTSSEAHHVLAEGSQWPVIPQHWEGFVRYRLSALAYDEDIELPAHVAFGRTVAETFATLEGAHDARIVGLRLPGGEVVECAVEEFD